jgi:hypothetical protein
VRPDGPVHYQLANPVAKLSSRAEAAVAAVRVTEKKDRFVDRPDHSDDIVNFVLETATFGGVRFAATSASDGVDRESLLEHRLDELPVRGVVAERAVDENERRPGSVLVLGHDHARCRRQAVHRDVFRMPSTFVSQLHHFIREPD